MSSLSLKFWLFYYDWAFALLKEREGTGIKWTYNPFMPETKDLDALGRIYDFRVVTERICGVNDRETVSYLPATKENADIEHLLSVMPLSSDQRTVLDIVCHSSCIESFSRLSTHVLASYPFNSPTIYKELDLVKLAYEARGVSK